MKSFITSVVVVAAIITTLASCESPSGRVHRITSSPLVFIPYQDVQAASFDFPPSTSTSTTTRINLVATLEGEQISAVTEYYRTAYSNTEYTYDSLGNPHDKDIGYLIHATEIRRNNQVASK